MNIAKIIGAGPLIVIDTDVDGSHKIKAFIKLFHIIEGTDADPAFADFPVNVGTVIGIFPVQV